MLRECQTPLAFACRPSQACGDRNCYALIFSQNISLPFFLASLFYINLHSLVRETHKIIHSSSLQINIVQNFGLSSITPEITFKDSDHNIVISSHLSYSSKIFLIISLFYVSLRVTCNNLEGDLCYSVIMASRQSIPDMSKIESLEGKNYKRWAVKVRFYLEQINVAYVLDDHVIPSDETDKLAYETKFAKDDKTFKGMLLHYMYNALLDIYMTYKHAKDIWDTLEKKYGVDDADI